MSKKNPRKYRDMPCAIDLFAGCGGTTLGLKKAGFNVLAAVEVDKIAASTYQANHPEIILKQADIRDLSPTALRRELKLNAGDLDLLAGCPPCQGFSTLRTQNGSKANRDSRNQLVLEILRFARTLLPKAIMMENVPGLVGRRPFKVLCQGLVQLGYSIKFEIKDAADYGVPQRRRRLILIAGRGIKLQFGREVRQAKTVRQAISGLRSPAKSRDSLHKIPERRSPEIKALIRAIPKNGGGRRDMPRKWQLNCHKDHSGFNDIYGRMAWDKVAPTITSGCFNPSKGRFLHPTQNRTITMREAAVLQSFPKNYFFDVAHGKQKIALMIGNALPPEFIRRNALAIARSLSIR